MLFHKDKSGVSVKILLFLYKFLLTFTDIYGIIEPIRGYAFR